jgi:hypothetical protein
MPERAAYRQPAPTPTPRLPEARDIGKQALIEVGIALALMALVFASGVALGMGVARG